MLEHVKCQRCGEAVVAKWQVRSGCYDVGAHLADVERDDSPVWQGNLGQTLGSPNVQDRAIRARESRNYSTNQDMPRTQVVTLPKDARHVPRLHAPARRCRHGAHVWRSHHLLRDIRVQALTRRVTKLHSRLNSLSQSIDDTV